MSFDIILFVAIVWIVTTGAGLILAGRRVRALRYEAVLKLRRQRAAQRAARKRDPWARWREDVA